MSVQNSTPAFPLFSAGVDWVTATATDREKVRALEGWFSELLMDQRAPVGTLTSARSLNYVGYRMDHAFFGVSNQGCMVQCGGPVAAYAARNLIAVSQNIARIDLQATVFSGAVPFDLVEFHWQELEHERRVQGRPFFYERRMARPAGDMLVCNRRVSDVYLRIYDKAAQMGWLGKHRVWRYEVEFKRRAAVRWANAVIVNGCASSVALQAVRSVTTAKGLECAIAHDSGHELHDRSFEEPTRDVRRWLRDSVRITLARAVKQHGAAAIAEDLQAWKLWGGGPEDYGCLS